MRRKTPLKKRIFRLLQHILGIIMLSGTLVGTMAQDLEEVNTMKIECTNGSELLSLINNDSYIRTVMKSFSGESFCIEICQDKIFFDVHGDGLVRIVDEKPAAYERILIDENGVQMPFSLRSRLAVAVMV